MRPLQSSSTPAAARPLLQRLRAAFTLVEMLAVLGIIGVVAAVAAPAVLGVINSTRMTQAGDELMGLLSQAQQIAAAESRPVEVRFYNMADPGSPGQDGTNALPRGVMLVKYYQTGEPDPRDPGAAALESPLAVADFGGLIRLPGGVVMSNTLALNSFMNLRETTATGAGAADLVMKQGGGYQRVNYPDARNYRSFLCLPEGTNLNATESWFVTLVSTNEANQGANEVRNFYTIQIEPVTGRLMSYRP